MCCDGNSQLVLWQNAPIPKTVKIRSGVQRSQLVSTSNEAVSVSVRVTIKSTQTKVVKEYYTLVCLCNICAY